MDKTVTAIIAAAGRGNRAGFEKNKLFAILPSGESVLSKTAKIFDENDKISHIIFTSSKEDFEEIEKIANNLTTPAKVVLGGQSRTESVKNALSCVEDEIVLIHDGARPFCSQSIIDDCIDAVNEYGSGVPIIPVTDTIAIISDNGEEIIKTTRENLRAIQTPQGFLTKKIKEAFRIAGDDDSFTDDSGVYCRYIGNVHAINGDKNNIKLTYPQDFNFFKSDIKAGVGFDLHKLVSGRKLILGGVQIEHDKGLLGHSDADVLTHAICDALLSALSLRDIGYHFSDKDEQYKDISSMILLEKVMNMLKDKGYKPENVAAVIMAQKPKLSGYIPTITKSLATALGIDICDVGITCTTTEGAGIIGKEEAIAVNAYCTITKINQI